MMKLYYTTRSPYARKVLVIAEEKGVADKITAVAVDLMNKPPELLNVNPLGKIPALVLEDGVCIYDSPVICEYLDGLNHSPRLIPEKGKERFAVLTLSALADGMMDACVMAYLENLRPEEKRFQPFVERQYDAIRRAVAELESKHQELSSSSLNVAQIGIASALGYLDFRLGFLEWRKHSPALAKWYDGFCQRASMQKTMPVA